MLTKFVIILLFGTTLELKYKLLIELLYYILTSREFRLLLGIAIDRMLRYEVIKRIFLVIIINPSPILIFGRAFY